LALVDEKSDGNKASDVFKIVRDPSRADDFAQAVNIGCCTLWHLSDNWPNLAADIGLRVSSDLLKATRAPNHDIKRDV